MLRTIVLGLLIEPFWGLRSSHLFPRVKSGRRLQPIVFQRPDLGAAFDDDDDGYLTAQIPESTIEDDCEVDIEGECIGERRREPLTITFVTGNQKKLNEVRAILTSDCRIPFNVTANPIDLDELQSDMPEKIAAAKCRLAARIIGGPVLVDDTSLCFTALGGMPGPYIKWFQDQIGAEGLVRMLEGFTDKTAWAQCSVAFSPGPGAEPCVFIGRTDGVIVDGVGEGGFGWDAIFAPVETGKTFGQMREEEKNTISHRARALRRLAGFLQENEDWVYGRASIRKATPRQPKDVFSFRRRRKMV